MTDLHTQLNHMSFPSICQLIWAKSIDGIPDQVTASTFDDPWEDCVNGKLTWAPHTKPAS